MGDKRKTRTEILSLLKLQGELTATALAEQLQVSPMAIRQHLQALQTERWVTYQEQRQALGRPVKLWQLTERATDFFPDSHGDLAADLLKGIQAVLGTEALEQVLAERTCRQIRIYREQLDQVAAPENWQDRAIALAQLRSQEGYMAEVISLEGALLLVENHCPICTAAQVCPRFCSSEIEVFRALLGTAVTVERVEHLMQGDRRCAYQIQSLASGS